MRLFIPLIAMALCFAACSKQTTKRPIAKDLHGQWQVTNAINQNGAYMYPSYENATLSFDADGTMACTNFNGKNYTGTWYLTTETIHTTDLSSSHAGDTSLAIVIVTSVFGAIADGLNSYKVHRIHMNMTDDNGNAVSWVWMRDYKKRQPKMWICRDRAASNLGTGFSRFQIKRL